MQSGVIADRFEIERVAGRGGMGYVYRALDRLTGKPVALKLLRETTNEDHVRRFLREVEVQASIEHPAIVRHIAHGIALDRAEPYLVIEWLEGEPLSAYLEKKAPSIADSLALARRVADALGFVHRRGLVHRDIKPANLYLVGGDPNAVKVLDFGIARAAADHSMTATGVLVGTMQYMAPEQIIERSVSLGSHSDVFSLGIVLFECLAGRLPFDEVGMALLPKMAFESVPPVSIYRPDLPGALVNLVARMVAREPGDRLADGDDVVRAIDALGSDLWDATPGQRAVTLTSVEQRIVTVVLVSMPGLASGASHGTLVLSDSATVADRGPAERDSHWRTVGDVARQYNAQGELLRDGTYLLVPAALGMPARQVAAATQCAMDIHELLPDASVVVVTGHGQRAEQMLFGEVLQRGGSMLADTSPGRVQLDSGTRALLDARFRVDDTGTLLPGVHTLERTAVTQRAALVGRRRELRVLSGLLEAIAEDESSAVAIVVGPPGIGKSRLVHEFASAASPGTTVLTTTCDPVRAGSPFGALAGLLARAAELPDGARASERRQRLRSYLDTVLVGDAPAQALFLAEIIHAPYDDDASDELRAARVSGELMQSRIRAAVLAWIGAVVSSGPALFVVEDLQWGDAPSVDVLDGALRTIERPWMLVATGRPELDREFPELWKRRSPHRLALADLPEKAAAQLAAEMLGEAGRADVVDRVVERAGGNPYLIEEIARSVRSQWRSADSNTSLIDRIPDSVLGMVQATLDALDPSERLVLRAASIFGLVFWRDAVAVLLPGAVSQDLDGWLDGLERREIVVRHAASMFDTTVELRIRQEVVRAAAYATLTEADRALGHRLAGEWLQRNGETNPIVLANHFDVGGLHESAARCYLDVARRARDAGDLPRALAAVKSGLRCVSEGELAGNLRAVHAELSNYSMRFEEARDNGLGAMDVLLAGSGPWCLAAAEVSQSCTRLGEVATIARIGRALLDAPRDPSARSQQAFAIAHTARAMIGWETTGPPFDELLAAIGAADLATLDAYALGRVHELLARVAELRHEPARKLAQFALAIDAARRAADFQLVLQLRSHVGAALLEVGAPGEAFDLLTECYELLEGQPLLQTYCKLHLAIACGDLARPDDGWKWMDAAIESVSRMGARYNAMAHGQAARMALHLRDFERTGHHVRAGLESAQKLVSWKVPLLAAQAALRVEHGDLPGALLDVEEFLPCIRRGDTLVFLEGFAWHEACGVLVRAGLHERARDAVARAVQMLRRRAGGFSGSDVQRYLRGMPEHAALLAMADTMGLAS